MTTETTVTTESEGAAPVEAAAALIEPVVEARVEAALAEEHSAEATETAETALAVAENVAETVQLESQWTNERISNLAMTMEAGMTALQSSISELSQRLNSASTQEQSSSTSTEEMETLTEAAAEVIAENPEAEAVMVATSTSETPTEASSETPTEAPAESVAVVVVEQASSVPQKPRLKARLI